MTLHVALMIRRAACTTKFLVIGHEEYMLNSRGLRSLGIHVNLRYTSETFSRPSAAMRTSVDAEWAPLHPRNPMWRGPTAAAPIVRHRDRAAGSQLGVWAEQAVYHPGVVNVYMAKAPGH